MQYILDRLQEWSTWVGYIALLSALGISPDLAGQIAAAGTGVAGLVAMVTKG